MNRVDPLIGQQLGDYTIVSLLGRGGMARVYKGFDPRLERYAAVKVIDAVLANSGDANEYRERFHREARSIARLRHPNIVSVYQFGEFANLYYMAMMFIEGRDLAYILRDTLNAKKRIPYGAVLRIGRDIATALDHAHREGVIHRDIKPSNIMVMRDGHAILTDFGLALSVPEGSIGNTFGSAHYIAPEQAVASNNAVPQSDLYSLAVVLYQMLVGKVPFDDPSAMSVAIKHLQEPPPPPSVANSELTPEIDAVLLKALEKQPDKRYVSGGALVIALEKALVAAGFDLAYVAEDGSLIGGAPDAPDRTREGATMVLPPEQMVTSADAVVDSQSANPAQPVNSDVLAAGSKPSAAARPVASPVWARELAGDQSSMIRPLPERRTRTTGVRTWIAVVLLLLVLGAGIVWLIGMSRTSTPTPPVVAQAASETPTARPTDTPRSTSTSTSPPTATARAASPTLRPTSTSRPTGIPVTVRPTDVLAAATAEGTSREASPTPVERSLVLSYDATMATLTNVGDRIVDLSNLEFAQRAEDGSERIFRANAWSNTVYSVQQFRPGDCLQVWTDAFVRIDPPTDCERRAWRSVSRPRWFWISSNGTSEFLIRRGRDIVATCAVGVEECTFTLDP